jgi:hypothetical protein
MEMRRVIAAELRQDVSGETRKRFAAGIWTPRADAEVSAAKRQRA